MFENQKFIYNSISNQNLLYANQLTVFTWNDIINSLRIQTNETTSYIEMLHKWLFGESQSVEHYDTGFIHTFTTLIDTVSESFTVHMTSYEQHLIQYNTHVNNFVGFVDSVARMYEEDIYPTKQLAESNLARIRSLERGGAGVDHYKGDFLSYEGLVGAYPSAEPGDYAFVNTTESDNVDKLVLYIWDDDANLWKETTSDKYVLSEIFTGLQESLLDGTYVVKKADIAMNYLDSQNSLRTIADSIEHKVEKVSGKQLTTNDFTDSYKAKLDGIAENANNYVLPSDVVRRADIANFVGEAYVNQKVAELVNSAPTTLDTLGEIASALQENESVVTTLNNAITNKQNKLTAGAGISISAEGVISVSYPNGDEEEF